MNAETDRDAFRAHVLESDRRAAADDVDGANTEASALDGLTGPWETAGRLGELLNPLLNTTEPRSVRFNAAAYLLESTGSDAAVATLEEVQAGDGMESISARVLLDRWRNRHT